MKVFLENQHGRISENEIAFLLNRITDVINCWQEKKGVPKRKDLEKIKEYFPDCLFLGR